MSESNTNHTNSGSKFRLVALAIGVVVILLLTAVLAAVLENNRLRKAALSGNLSQSEPSAAQDNAQDASRDAAAQSGGSESTPSAPAGNASSGNTSSESAASPQSPADIQPVSQGSCKVTYSAGNGWEDGSTKMCSLELQISNDSDATINGWNLVLKVKDLVTVQGWNGTFSNHEDYLTIGNAEHNREIPANGSVTLSCNIGTGSELSILSASLNGTDCAVEKGTVNQNAQNQQSQNGQKAPVNVPSLLKRPDSAVQGDDWLFTDGNKIVDKDGKQVWLTGVNWFGYNTGTNTFDGLWNSQLVPTVKGIADHGFNLIRVPFSAELINQWAAGDYPRANYNNAYNDELNSMNSLEIFDYFLQLAETNGIKVLIDIHCAETNASGHMVNLWYTDKVSVEQYYSALEWMAERYKDNDTIIAYDLKNEPHGKPNEGKGAAIWNNSKDANNWKYVAETAAGRVLAKNPNVLILVEGTEIYPKKKGGDYSSTNSEDYYFNWWGGNLRAVADYPIDLGKYQNKLVYSPHDYGPTVFEQPWFEGNYTYDSLMKDCWYDNWLYIHDKNTAPLLIGEWGGFMREPNLTWMTYMRQLISTYHLNHTFWCLNANSGDTGGLLLDDFTTWDNEKYTFVKEVLWQENGKFVGLDHAIPLGKNGITLKEAKGLK